MFAIHILLSLLFVYKLNLGVSGAMLALMISSWSLVIGEFIYIFRGWCPNSWKGFTFAAFKDLMPLVKLSVSSGVMLCLELWYNVVLVLLAGYMANAEVAISAFSICLNISVWEFMKILGFLGAACCYATGAVFKSTLETFHIKTEQRRSTTEVKSMDAFFRISTNIFFAVLMANKCKQNQSVQSEVTNYGKICYLYFNRTKRRPEYQIWD
ncbi:hypothetical protein HanIR_Chr14g0671411 [Helianthus annuus]|nr:hypothetical protein HanIR_Chr14g0671411 [Helianthus annuus]